MQPDIQTVQDVFFDAMAAGWAHDVQKETIAEMPGSKIISFTQGDFRVLDHYLTSPSGKSAGTTAIWHQDQPVWVMQYGGHYTEFGISFLKSALRKAYTERNFYGGRGPEEMSFTDHVVYQNRIERNSFEDFLGEERVFILGEAVYGYHWYRGMLLLKT